MVYDSHYFRMPAEVRDCSHPSEKLDFIWHAYSQPWQKLLDHIQEMSKVTMQELCTVLALLLSKQLTETLANGQRDIVHTAPAPSDGQ